MDDNKTIVRRYIEEMVSKGVTDDLSSVIDENYVDLYLPANKQRGVQVAKSHIEAVRSTYPDLHVEVLEQYAEDSIVITTIKATATHSGSWLNIKPTNKRIEIEGVNIDRVENGKIVAHKGFANTFEALLKINALPGVGFG